MAAPLSTVFLSYRRNVSSFIARAVFQDLRQHGYDVFMDVESIDSGQFEPIILAQIAARAYFLVLLTPGTLAGCQEPDDWLRREIEYAMELGRNIVPILVNDFRFDDNALASLTGRLRDLPRYNGLPLPQDYFNEAMERLRTRFLRQPGQGIITPAPPQDAPVVQQKIAEAARQSAPTQQKFPTEDDFNRGLLYNTSSYDYDVFLSHNNADKDAVETIARRLEDEAALRPFFDKWHLIPGNPWQEELEQALKNAATCAMFIGPGGIGPWENEEMRSALDIRARNPGFRVIPVLLPEAVLPQQGRLPRFLARLTWVDFRHGLHDPEAFHRLVGGIRGHSPGRGETGTA